MRALGLYFLFGVFLSAVFRGGGTIPLLQAWLMDGMSMGSAVAFMITGPSNSICNDIFFCYRTAGKPVRVTPLLDNYLPVFDMSEETALDKHVEEQIETAVLAVTERKSGIPKATEEQRKLHAYVADLNRQTPAFNNGRKICCSGI